MDEREIVNKLDPNALLEQNAVVRRRAEIALAKYLKRRGILTADSSTQPYPSMRESSTRSAAGVVVRPPGLGSGVSPDPTD